MTVGALEILLVLFFVLLIIGPRRVANLGRSLGRGVRDFKLEFDRDKKSVGDQRSAINEADDTDGDGR
jgi:TatA/E family protein of Tat protein translocase